MRPPATDASPNADIDLKRMLTVSAAAGVFLALIGALGTDDMPLWRRVAYWTPLLVGGSLIAYGVVGWLVPMLRARLNLWQIAAVLSLAISVPISALVWAYSALLFGGGWSINGLAGLFGSVLVISAAMTGIMMAINQPGRQTHAPPTGAPALPVRFLERLPPKLRGAALYAVSSEDHYLRLHTSKGSDLILMRLGDAIIELEGLEGAQTHRSWWVARDGVESARREGDRVTLVLKGGAEAPVSRPNIKPLREAAWF